MASLLDYMLTLTNLRLLMAKQR